MEWETVIGLEVHVQLKTASKIFSGSPTTYGAPPNTQTSAIDLGLPGVLPVLNKKAIELALRFGASIDAEIAPISIFARKNYFYPDLPKGYQISQFELPIVGKGHLDIELSTGETKRIGITRAHLEEDAGKSVHDALPGYSGIDLNRAGTPLLEIVSEPDLRSEEQVIAYLKQLHTLVRYLEISDGNLEEGSFRCDVNLSMRPRGQKEFGTRTELKNLNSFRFIEKAIEYERDRQIQLLENGEKVIQATCLFDPDKNETRIMRTKEEAHDYRYFPDPDLLPVEISSDFLESIKKNLPELPAAKQKRFITELGLASLEATLLTNDLSLASYFETCLNTHPGLTAKLIANWMVGEVIPRLQQSEKSEIPVTPTELTLLLLRIQDKTISRDIAKKIFDLQWKEGGNADTIIEQQGLEQISDTGALEKIIDEILEKNPSQVEQFKAGKEKLLAYFVGQVMKATKGKANAAEVTLLLKKKTSTD